jgi:hypothetical protein
VTAPTFLLGPQQGFLLGDPFVNFSIMGEVRLQLALITVALELGLTLG